MKVLMKKNQASKHPGLIPPTTIAEIGRAIFGPHWQAPLARAMKVQEQVVRRWTNDGCPVMLHTKLHDLLNERVADIHRVLGELETFSVEAE